MPATHIKVIYSLVVVLFLLNGFTLFQVYQLQVYVPGGSAQGGAGQAVQGAGQNIIVGAAPLLDNIAGIIVSIGTNSLQIKDKGGAVVAVSVAANTPVKLAGKMKDAATRQKELDAYNAQVNQLIQDPVKNKAALAALELPPLQEVSPISFSDLHMGDTVLVAANGTDAAGAYSALSVTKSAAAAQ